MTGLWTIGYEGAAFDDFLETLRRTSITKVLDVREIPVSQCKGFSKKALEQALSDYGIDYQHERRLGSPRDVRHRLRATGDLQRFLRDFKAHLAGQQDLLASQQYEETICCAAMSADVDNVKAQGSLL